MTNASLVTPGSTTKQRISFGLVPCNAGVKALGIASVTSGAVMCGGGITIGGAALGSPSGAPFSAQVPRIEISSSLSQRPWSSNVRQLPSLTAEKGGMRRACVAAATGPACMRAES